MLDFLVRIPLGLYCVLGRRFLASGLENTAGILSGGREHQFESDWIR